MPTAAFDREIRVSADATTTWKTLTDVERVVSWVSILDDVEVCEVLQSYRAVLADRLGPFKLRADLDIAVSEVVDGAHLVVRASGEDRQVSSRITVDAVLDLTEQAGDTVIAVKGTYEVAGRVATLGASTINKKADKVIQEFFGRALEELS